MSQKVFVKSLEDCHLLWIKLELMFKRADAVFLYISSNIKLNVCDCSVGNEHVLQVTTHLNVLLFTRHGLPTWNI